MGEAPLLDDIDELLERKQTIDQSKEVNLAGYDLWMVDALETLLRVAAHTHAKMIEDDD